ncbi:hypothetical protein E2C01_072128 [Portunus trituberculatus]|uniref:Uncharacterized protein n=1 Tax=Portunus trituberculatus TaxID=210409 RepID=A0A5B7I6Z7_PORTR|nr:hypothetical protein [Portunus trituberculatus]
MYGRRRAGGEAGDVGREGLHCDICGATDGQPASHAELSAESDPEAQRLTPRLYSEAPLRRTATTFKRL